MKKILLAVGVLTLVAAGVLPFFYDKYFNYRVPSNWSVESKFLGDTALADEKGNLPETRDIMIYNRMQKVKEWSPDRAVIGENYTIHDSKTGTIIYQIELNWNVDPKTGNHLKEGDSVEGAGLPYLFPINSEKKDYRIYNYYLEPFTVHFDRTEEIGGLTTYVYKFTGDINANDSYRGSDEYPGIKPEPGQALLFTNMLIEYYVEPTTGEIVKAIEESGGDYFVDAKTNQRLAPIMIWTGNMTDDSITRQVQIVLNHLNQRSYYTLWCPIVLAIIGLVLVVIGVRGNKQTESTR